MIRTLLAGLFVSALCVMPAAAQTGPDFVFNVPVNIDNVPPLNGRPFELVCGVQAQTASGSILSYLSTDGLPAHPTYAIGPGGFHDTIRVELTLPAGVRRADVLRWSCDANFFTVTTPAGTTASMPNPTLYTPLTGQAVARSQLHVGAEFPRP